MRPTCTPPASGSQVELRHGSARAVVVEVGAGLRSFSVDGRDLIDGYDTDQLAGVARGQILVPWPNRVRDGVYEFDGTRHQLPLTEPQRHNAIHGLTRWMNWTIAEHTEGHARLEYLLHPQPGYPFTLALAVDYSLDDAGLLVQTTAANIGTAPCPFGTGAHPYLTAGTSLIDSCILEAPGRSWMRTDERLIPVASEPVADTPMDFRDPRAIGATKLDTAYASLRRDDDGRARVRLTDPDSDRGVTLWQDESYPYLMLFTGDGDPDPSRRRRGLGVEPMTCAPNALQTGEGLLTLPPGVTFLGTWGITSTPGPVPPPSRTYMR